MCTRFLALVTAVFLSLVVSAQPASAQETASVGVSGETAGATGIGAGIQATLTGLAGPAVTYQAAQFHITGLMAVNNGDNNDPFGPFGNNDDTDFFVAGRFFYEIHSAEIADFGVGGGLGVSDDDGSDDADFHIEGGAEIRAFLAPNVALSTTLGMGFVIEEGDDDFGILGQLVGGMGVTYFFF